MALNKRFLVRALSTGSVKSKILCSREATEQRLWEKNPMDEFVHLSWKKLFSWLKTIFFFFYVQKALFRLAWRKINWKNCFRRFIYNSCFFLSWILMALLFAYWDKKFLGLFSNEAGTSSRSSLHHDILSTVNSKGPFSSNIQLQFLVPIPDSKPSL